MPHSFEVPEFEGEPQEFVPSTRVSDEIKAMSSAARVATSEAPKEIKAKHFKIGSFDTDLLSTETSGFGPGMMTAEEMSSVESRLSGQWKDLPHHEQNKAVREYLEQRRARENRPN